MTSMVVLMPSRVVRMGVRYVQSRTEQRVPTVNASIENADMGHVVTDGERRAVQQILNPVSLLSRRQFAKEEFRIGLNESDFCHKVEQFSCMLESSPSSQCGDDHTAWKTYITWLNLDFDLHRLFAELVNHLGSGAACVPQPNLKPMGLYVVGWFGCVSPKLGECGAPNVVNCINK